MTKRRARSLAATAALGALALAGPLAPALAQSVGDFQLRPGTPTPTPRPAGPVDSDNPNVGPRPAPAPAPSPTVNRPAPTPSIAASPVTAPPTAERPTQLAPGQRPLPPRVIQQQPQGVPTQPGAFPGQPQTGASPLAAPSQAAPRPAGPLPNYPSLTETGQSFDPIRFLSANWPWLAGLFGLLLAGWLGRVWLRKREAREPVIEFERPVVQRPAPEASPPAAEPEPAPAPEPEVQPELEVPTGPLGIEVEALRLSATLLNTTLNYSLALTNRSRKKLGPVTVSGDMIAAHAKTPVEQQLGLDGAALERRHELPGLAPGESATLKGEIRLPLAMITPIKAGEAALFIPLARFQVEAAQAKGDPLFLARTFVVGEAGESADAGLRPFRLDLGPRVYSRIAQREVLATA